MFQAYSKNNHKLIKATQAKNLNDSYLCPWCNIQLKLKGINSTIVSPYFSKYPSIDHKTYCSCNFFHDLYNECFECEKKSIEDILNRSNNTCSSVKPNSSTVASNGVSIKKINTPKQLLKYCLSFSLDSEYTTGVFINDIIIDSRNISTKLNGTSGVYLVVGNTYKFDKKRKTIEFSVSCPNTRERLNATVYVSEKQLNEMCSYIFNSFKKFSGHPIAVLGDWTKLEDGKIFCDVNNPANVIYRFAEKK